MKKASLSVSLAVSISRSGCPIIGKRRLFFIPGDWLLPATANLPCFRKEKILKGLLVVAPETTSVLNAYSFIKSALFRLRYRSLPNRSRERDQITAFAAQRREGSDTKLGALVSRLAEIDPASGDLARSRPAAFTPRVISTWAAIRETFRSGQSCARSCAATLR